MCLNLLGNPDLDILVLGDFSLPHIEWRQAGKTLEVLTLEIARTNSWKIKLFTLSEKFSLSQQIRKPTRGSNMLHLIFTNNVDPICDVTISNTLYPDHNLIQVKTGLDVIPPSQNIWNIMKVFSVISFLIENRYTWRMWSVRLQLHLETHLTTKTGGILKWHDHFVTPNLWEENTKV